MKKKNTKAKVLKKTITPELPQNIIPVGERVFDDKNIYIHQKVYAQIHKFAANKTENEHGGILVGRVVNEMGKENTIIEGFIEAKYNAATPTTLTFTHETWDHFHSEMDRKYKDKKIVGWIHTHPNFGIFLSENDRFIQENFFTDTNQVAYVVDPIQNDEGFFFWVDGKLERCPGFYLFDKNGVNIKQKPWVSDEEDDSAHVKVDQSKTKIFAIAMIAIMLVNIFVTIYQANCISNLEKQVEDQSVIIRYGMYGIAAPEVSVLANNIRVQVKAYEEAERKAAIESAQKKNEQKASDATEPTQSDDKKDEAPNSSVAPDNNNNEIEQQETVDENKQQ